MTVSQVFEAQHSVGAAPPTDVEAQQLQQHWHPSLRDNPYPIQLYSAAPYEARPELLAKIEAGVNVEDLQSVVIQWMIEAATSSHANAQCAVVPNSGMHSFRQRASPKNFWFSFRRHLPPMGGGIHHNSRHLVDHLICQDVGIYSCSHNSCPCGADNLSFQPRRLCTVTIGNTTRL